MTNSPSYLSWSSSASIASPDHFLLKAHISLLLAFFNLHDREYGFWHRPTNRGFNLPSRKDWVTASTAPNVDSVREYVHQNLLPSCTGLLSHPFCGSSSKHRFSTPYSSSLEPGTLNPVERKLKSSSLLSQLGKLTRLRVTLVHSVRLTTSVCPF